MSVTSTPQKRRCSTNFRHDWPWGMGIPPKGVLMPTCNHTFTGVANVGQDDDLFKASAALVVLRICKTRRMETLKVDNCLLRQHCSATSWLGRQVMQVKGAPASFQDSESQSHFNEAACRCPRHVHEKRCHGCFSTGMCVQNPCNAIIESECHASVPKMFKLVTASALHRINSLPWSSWKQL
jgi:hypothetical protein